MTSFSISVLDSISHMLSHTSNVAREAILSVSGISSGSLAYATVPVGWTASGENKLRLVAG